MQQFRHQALALLLGLLLLCVECAPLLLAAINRVDYGVPGQIFGKPFRLPGGKILLVLAHQFQQTPAFASRGIEIAPIW